MLIFRTPSYAFSYFSVALVMPLMVYSCTSLGASLVNRLIGISVNAELALFLTLLFGALTNAFCSTNISREGESFFLSKALPVSFGQVFFSKIFFCMLVSTFSQGISALTLLFTGYVTGTIALLLFFAGVIFSFAQICFATRYDFDHACLSGGEAGEAQESGGAVSACILLGLAVSFLVGGGALGVRLFSALRFQSVGYLPWLFAGGMGSFAAAGAAVYLLRGLKRKYYEFSGGAA